MTVPVVTVVLRKSYGLGAMAMAGGSTHVPLATIAWPTAEFGGMNIEGAVRLAYRSELDALEGDARRALYEAKVEQLYEKGAAANVASYLEIDDVIDPADTRETVARLLKMRPAPETDAKRPARFIDTW
jgi:acetyl-CoA carboxylase carboxyltransferase component